MATILLYNQNRALDLNGFSIPGALATFRDSGTNRTRTVYANPECTVPHPSPLAADGAGVFPPVYDAGNGDAAVSVTDADGVMLAGYPLDPAPSVSTDQEGASGISFDPTPQIPVKNVQKAIERVQANILAPLADYGLGVTGNTALLADIDAPGIASGFYRYDDTTLGTLPEGVTRADGGLVLVFRRTSFNALMLLVPGGSDRIYRRRLSSTWQAWSWLLDTEGVVADSVWQAGTSTVPAPITPAAARVATRGSMNVAGSAPMYACRAWGNFDGRAGQVERRNGGNFASVTREGTGKYAIRFSTNMPHANYSISVAASNNDASTEVIHGTITSAGFSIQCNRDDSDQDAATVTFSVFC